MLINQRGEELSCSLKIMLITKRGGGCAQSSSVNKVSAKVQPVKLIKLECNTSDKEPCVVNRLLNSKRLGH